MDKTLRLVRISLLIRAIQRVLRFFSGKLFYKSNRKLFSCVCIAWYKHERGWENSRQLCKPSTSSRVCITVLNSPNPSRVYIRLCKHGKRFLLLNYKITKIVRALWLAERSVCMRVCKHGCGVKLFGFSRANNASTNLKKVFEFKTRQVYFIYPFLCRLKLGKSLQRRCVNFFRLSWHFKREKSVFWKASFCKTRTDYARKTSCTRLWDW